MSRNEQSRLRQLHDLGVLDTPPEPRFDRITRMAAEMFEAPIATVSLVDKERQWFKSKVGIEAAETPRSEAFCAHAIDQEPHSVLVIENATTDPRFAENTFVTGDPNIRFYAGATLTTQSGENVGTLCVIDRTPRQRPSEQELNKLKALAAMVVDEMELSRRSKIADQRQALLELAEAMSGVGYWRFDLAASHITWSDEVYAIHGVDKATFDPNLDANLAFFDDHDRGVIEGLLQRAIDTGEGYDFELRLRRADGKVRNVVCKARCEKDEAGKALAIVGVFQDVSDYVRAREEARTSEALYKLVAANTPDIIGRLSIEGEIRFVSPSMTTLTGHAVEDVIGHKSFEFIHKDDVPGVIAAFQDIMVGRALDKPLRYRIAHKMGGWVWVEANPRVIVGAGGEAEFIDVLRDIRGQIALEESMQRATAEAQAAAMAKSEFLANMSHEIRTPLNAIVGYSTLVAESVDLPANLRRHADVVAASSKSLIRIINDILDFSALEVGAVEIAEEPFDLRATLDASLATLMLQADGKGLSLRRSVHPAVARRYVGDGARIQQVLMNLIGNAIKFTAAGEVEIRCTPSASSDQTLRIAVRDTGMGIPAETQKMLFSRFTQADGSVARRFGGTGLGLAVSKQIVTRMGGAIGVDSIEGEGATFWFTLPLAPMSETIGEAAKGLFSDREVEASVRRILFVDDHDVNRELGAMLLTAMGHEVVLAADGVEAIAAVEREAFDLVFMDVQMPGLDGLAATRSIRSFSFLSSLPIVALTAHAMRAQVNDCLAAGMNGHVPKPFTGRSLGDAVSKWARSSSDGVARDIMASPAFMALQKKFIAQTVLDLEKISSYLRSPTAELPPELKSLIHRLAGSAGTLGFHAPGKIALSLDQTITRDGALARDDLTRLKLALEQLPKAS